MLSGSGVFSGVNAWVILTLLCVYWFNNVKQLLYTVLDFRKKNVLLYECGRADSSSKPSPCVRRVGIRALNRRTPSRRPPPKSFHPQEIP
jgi:hypothetical protein